jgi:glucose/arabinose dehydrogenase
MNYSPTKMLTFVGLLAVVTFTAACSSSSTSASTSSTTAATSTTAASTTTSTTTAAPTTPVATTTPITPAAWADAHGTNITLVIATANGLVSAIGKADATAISTSCSALSRNYKTLLQPIRDPPVEATAKLFNQAKDEIYNAQRHCSGGVIRSPDMATAALEAKTGAGLLHQVLDASG